MSFQEEVLRTTGEVAVKTIFLLQDSHPELSCQWKQVEATGEASALETGARAIVGAFKEAVDIPSAGSSEHPVCLKRECVCCLQRVSSLHKEPHGEG
nr:ret finger protein-like 2 [Equus asinus]